MATETFVINVQTKGTVRAARNIREVGRSAGVARKALALMRNALVAIAALRVFSDLTRTLVEFSDQMLVVSAVTQATAAQFQELRDVAKGLGATTRFTAAEAAEGMAFLGRAGLEVTEIIAAIPSTLDLAAASQLELGRAADIASNLMTSFGRSASEVPEIVDTLVFTANNANTTVQQLADGLKLFAPIASQLGIDLNQASSAMAVLGDAGIQASLAGTGVRRVITDLTAPTGNLAKSLKFLGVSFEDVNPATNDFFTILRRLKDAGVGAANASLLFGKRGGFIAAQLLASLDAMEDFNDELNEQEGTARRAAEELEKSIGVALRLVRSAFQNLLIEIGDSGFEDFANRALRVFAEALRALARNMDNAVIAVKTFLAALVVRKIVIWTAALVKSSGALIIWTRNALTAEKTNKILAASFARLRAALLRIPFVAIVTGLTLLAGGLAAFSSEIRVAGSDVETLEDVFVTFGNLIKTSIVESLNSAGFEFKDFREIVQTVFSRVAAAIKGILATFAGMGRAVKLIFARIQLVFKAWLVAWLGVISKVVRGASDLKEAFGGEPIAAADTLEAKLKEVQQSAANLAAQIRADGGVFNAFLSGGRDFLRNVDETARARLVAERDAAILLTEESNRRAARARAAAAQEGPPRPDPGKIINLDDVNAAEDLEKAIANATKALRGLEGQVSPTVDAFNNMQEAQNIINEAKAKGVTLLVEEKELMRRLERQFLGLPPSMEQVAERQKVLNLAYQRGVISLRELNDLTRENQLSSLEGRTDSVAGIERAFLKIQEQASDSAAFTEMVFTDAFKTLEDNFVSFIQEGTFELDKFFQNLSEQLLRLAGALQISRVRLAVSGRSSVRVQQWAHSRGRSVVARHPRASAASLLARSSVHRMVHSLRSALSLRWAPSPVSTTA